MADKVDSLYVVEAPDGLLKIGRSVDPSARLSGLQTGSPVRLSLAHLADGEGVLEGRVHSLLSEYHEHGEWFRVDIDTVLAAIDEARQMPTEISHTVAVFERHPALIPGQPCPTCGKPVGMTNAQRQVRYRARQKGTEE